MDHLLLHWVSGRSIVPVILSLFGVEWVMSRRIIEMLDYWRGQLGNQSVVATWRMVILCLVWSIWREWNARCFQTRYRRKS